MDKEAKAQICLTLNDEPLNGVLHIVTSKEVWERLCSCYEGKGKQTQAYLIGEIFQCTFTDKLPLEPQLNALHHKTHILTSLGLKLCKDSVLCDNREQPAIHSHSLSCVTTLMSHFLFGIFFLWYAEYISFIVKNLLVSYFTLLYTETFQFHFLLHFPLSEYT